MTPLRVGMKFILGSYLLTVLVLYLKFPENIIIGGYRPFKGCTEPMVDLCIYIGAIIPEEYHHRGLQTI